MCIRDRATAALQVAKAAVQLAGKVGEGVMKAVNAVIQGALSFFYINRLELYGKANMSEQEFRASIEFVALGKTYRYETKMGHSALKSDAEMCIRDSCMSTEPSSLPQLMCIRPLTRH